jgi:DNA helicase-2/ATP-dependent DNA helicase PcrA
MQSIHHNDTKLDIQLNKQQSECLSVIDGNVLILSGAGTGKTRIIISRFLKYVENGTFPSEILCVTFSNKAANEIANRLRLALGDIDGLWIGTFHRICFRLLQKYGDIDSKISIIDETDQQSICNKLDIIDFLRDIQLYKEQLAFDDSPSFRIAIRIYQEFLEKNKMIDFGDIILKTVKLLEENTEVLSMIKSRFKYVLVDEYQDTSKLQNHLITLLSDNNLCCVGDDDQSIYGWRGACVDNILKFQHNFYNVITFRLEQNYRSSKHILKVANFVIQQNRQRMIKQIWTESNGHKVKITCTKFEPEHIANEIRALPEDENIGILVRSAKIIRPIELALIKHNIPYVVIGGLRFFEKAEIKTIFAYLKAVFLEDILSIERVLMTPKRGIGSKKLERLINQIQNGLNLYSALREIGHGDFADQIAKWRSMKSESPDHIMRTIWSESGCQEFFTERQENIDLLIKKITEFDSIESFLQNFFSIDTEDNARIVISTIHSAKGLEYDNVFIPGMVEGVFPSSLSIMEGNLEEERRVAYVAFTRAKKRLFITYSLNYIPHKKNNLFGPSRFLFNLPRDSIDFDVI